MKMKLKGKQELGNIYELFKSLCQTLHFVVVLFISEKEVGCLYTVPEKTELLQVGQVLDERLEQEGTIAAEVAALYCGVVVAVAADVAGHLSHQLEVVEAHLFQPLIRVGHG